MSETSTSGFEQTECTNMNCRGEAEFAYWMPDLGQFSRVRSPEHDMLDDGDLAPYVCESCRDHMAGSSHWDGERFFRPEEKLVTDGGTERGVIYTSNGAAHIVADAEPHLDDNLRERVSALCGASSPPKLLPINGLRLTDEYQKGKVCDRCLERLQERGATISGFIKNGEIRSSFTDTNRIGTPWGNECPRCGHLEERDHGPGYRRSAPTCPECDWPMNCVDLDLIDRSVGTDTDRSEVTR